MHTEELIIKGTPAQFLTWVDTFDDMRILRLPPGAPRDTVFVTYTPAHGPWTGHSSDVIRASVNIHPPGWQGKLNVGIEATSLPDNKTRLVLWCEEAGWPEVEPLWNELKNELQRLGVLFDEDKTETETMSGTTIVGYPIHEYRMPLTCDVATFVGAVEAYSARLANFSIHNLPFYEVTKQGEKSAQIIIWPSEGAERPIDRGRKETRDKAGMATVQAGPAGGCLVILNFSDLNWPSIQERWNMLIRMLDQYGYIGDAPTAAEPEAEPQPERPKVKRGRKTRLTPDVARGACMVYHGLKELKKGVTLQDMADALGVALGLPEGEDFPLGTFEAYWQAYKDGKL